MEAASLSLSPCGSLSLVAGLEATHKSVAIYGQSQSPAVLIQGLLGPEVGIASCTVSLASTILCECVFTQVYTGSPAGTDLAQVLHRLSSLPVPSSL